MAADRSIVILGAGAVGSYLGARLGMTGTRVTLVGRPRVVEAVQARGLILRDVALSSATRPAATTESNLPPADLVILAVRAFDVASALGAARGLLAPNGLLLAMQNGVGTDALLVDALGADCVVAGTLTAAVRMDEPGIVTRFSGAGGLALATLDGSPAAPWFVDLLRATDLPTRVLDDYRALRWSKLALNMLGAAASSILDTGLDEIVADPGLFRLEQLSLREAGRVMDAQGIQAVSLPGYPVPLLRLAMRLPGPLAQRVIGPRLAGARRGRSPGARADMARGRSEIPWLNGAVAAAARERGMRAPVSEAFTELVEELLAHPERQADYRGRPDRLLDYMRRRGVRL